MANVVPTWVRNIDFSAADANLQRSLIRLTLTAASGTQDFPATGLILPSLAQVGLQNVKAVRSLPNIFTLTGLGIVVPHISISNPALPRLFLYGNAAATDFMEAKSSSGGVTIGAYTLDFELVGQAG